MPKQNCLIIDDSRMSRMMIQKFIADAHPDWTFEEAPNGQEALIKADQHVFQIITVDFNMPGMDGIELAKILRPKFPEAKIALLTANIQESIRKKASEINVDFIPKPITEDKIKAYVCN